LTTREREPAGTADLIETPEGWRRIEGDGWRIHADGHVEAPIAFAEAVAEGLEGHPRWLPYRYLYDRRGSEIYERITRQPEYYPTRTEEAILAASAEDVRARVGDATLVELGSGSSAKTRRLLDAWTAAGDTSYVPVDISRGALEAACAALAEEYPEVRLEALCSSYERAMPSLSSVSPACFVFLGSTVGNFENEELDRFLERVSRHLRPGEHCLLGIDLAKDPRALETAFEDAARATAGTGKNEPTRNSPTEMAHPHSRIRNGSARSSSAPTAMRPAAIAIEKNISDDPLIHCGNASSISE